jgi:hypothetical protein
MSANVFIAAAALLAGGLAARLPDHHARHAERKLDFAPGERRLPNIGYCILGRIERRRDHEAHASAFAPVGAAR